MQKKGQSVDISGRLYYNTDNSSGKKMLIMKSITEKPWYQWVIAALSFLMVFTVLGFCSSSRSVYITAITEALGISRSAYSLSDSFRYITSTICNVFFGFLIAKFGARRLIGAGFGCLIISSLLYSVGNHVAYFYVGSIFLGLGVAWTTTTMVGAVVNRWFTTNRGSVMGAVLAANGLGGALALQIVTPIINESTFGFRNAYRLVALILLAVGILVVTLFRNEPKNAADTQPGQKKRRGRSWPGVPYTKAVKMAYFYGSLFCIFATGMILQGIYGVAAPLLSDKGLDSGYISLVLSVSSLVLTASKFAVGFVYDRAGLRTTSNICFIASIAVVVLLMMVDNSDAGKIVAMVYGIGISMAMPLETIMLPIYAADLFGEHSYNKIQGLFSAFNTAGFALGAPVANLCYDLTGSYNGALFAGGILITVATIVMQFVITAAHKEQIKAETETSGA